MSFTSRQTFVYLSHCEGPLQGIGARREASEPSVRAHADRALEQQLPAVPTKSGHLAVSLHTWLGTHAQQNTQTCRREFFCCLQVPCLDLPQFLPNSSSLDDVSYRKDTSLRVKPIDLSRLQRPDASALNSAAASNTGATLMRLLPIVPGDVANAPSTSARESIKSAKAEVQLGLSSNAEKLGIKSAQHGVVDSAAAQLKWLPSPAVYSPQQTRRLSQQPSSWQLSSAAGTACSGISPSSNNLAAKSWQQLLSTASAHEQWVAHKHTAYGRMSGTGDEEEWGELLVRVPKQAGAVMEKLMQQLPQALAGSVHTQSALQV